MKQMTGISLALLPDGEIAEPPAWFRILAFVWAFFGSIQWVRQSRGGWHGEESIVTTLVTCAVVGFAMPWFGFLFT